MRQVSILQRLQLLLFTFCSIIFFAYITTVRPMSDKLHISSDILQNISKDRYRGRGSRSNKTGRYEKQSREDFDDGWESLQQLEPFKTYVQEEKARSIIATNDSPDIPFDTSINPYRGCEHGCPYCFARPTHAYLGMSPGLDFENHLFAKVNAAELLEKTLAQKTYVPHTIALGSNTDPYQPIERTYKITRSLLEICERTNHPVAIVTKSALVLRDQDILQSLAEKQLVKVAISVTSLDRKLARKLEPRASTPRKRLQALDWLSRAGIATTVMVAPIIPAINDAELEKILDTAQRCGVESATYVLLRLPLELKEIFEDWLHTDFPDRAKHVYTLMRSMRGGELYDAKWGERMRGTGPYAEQIAQRFAIATKRLGINERSFKLRTDLFQRPILKGGQMELF